jgi:hypothetical protein
MISYEMKSVGGHGITIEHESIQKAIRAAGFDGFYVLGGRPQEPRGVRAEARSSLPLVTLAHSLVIVTTYVMPSR